MVARTCDSIFFPVNVCLCACYCQMKTPTWVFIISFSPSIPATFHLQDSVSAKWCHRLQSPRGSGRGVCERLRQRLQSPVTEAVYLCGKKYINDAFSGDLLLESLVFQGFDDSKDKEKYSSNVICTLLCVIYIHVQKVHSHRFSSTTFSKVNFISSVL